MASKTKKKRILDIQRRAAALMEELSRCYKETETALRFCYLSLAAKHPSNLSYLATIPAVQRTLMESAEYVRLSRRRLILHKRLPNRIVYGAKIWRKTNQRVEALKVGQEIAGFIKKLPKKGSPFAAPKNTSKKLVKQLQQLFPDTDLTELPHWGFATEPWTPQNSLPGDPLKGATDVVLFGQITTNMLRALRFLCMDVTDEDARKVYRDYMEWLNNA